MTKKQLQRGVLFFTLFIDMLGFGIVMPILPRYGEFLGASSWEIGLLVGIFSLAQLVMLPFWGHLSDRIGRKPVLMISVFGTMIGYLIMGSTRSIIIMMVARVIDGAAGANISTIRAWVSDITKPKERSKMMGQLGAAYGLGFIFGPALGGWASHYYGFSSPMYIAAGLSMVNLVLVATTLSESLEQKQKKEKDSKLPSLFLILEHVDKKSYLPVLVTYFFFVVGFSMVVTLLPVFFYHRYGINEQQTGGIYAMIGVIAIIVEGGLFGFLSRKLGDRLLSIIGTILLAVAFFLIPLTWSISVVVVVCAIMGVGDSLLSAALPSIVSRSVNEQWQGSAFGFYESAASLARCFGPLLAGLFLAIDLHRPIEHYAQTSCWMASGFLLLSFFFSLKLLR